MILFRKTYKSVYDSIKPNEKLLENIISGNVKKKKPYYRQVMSVAAALIIIAGASTAYPLLVQKPTVEKTTVVQKDKVDIPESETTVPQGNTATEDVPVAESEPVQEKAIPQTEAVSYMPAVADKPPVSKAEKAVTDEVKTAAEPIVPEDIPVSGETVHQELLSAVVAETEEVSTEEASDSQQEAENTEEATDEPAADDTERVAFKVNSPTGSDAEEYINYIGFDFRKYLNLPDKMADTTENGQIIPDEENPVDNGHFTFCGENDSLVEFFVTKNGGFAQTYEDTVSKQYGSNTAYWLGSDTSFTVKFSRNDIYFMVVSYGLTETELEEMISGLITEN